MKKIALVVAPPFWIRTPHIGLAYLKGMLKNHQVDIYDLNMEIFHLLKANPKMWLVLNRKFEAELYTYLKKDYPEFIQNIINKLKDYDFVGFSLFKRNRIFSFSLIEELKKKSRKVIIIGGPEVLQLSSGEITSSLIRVEGEGELPLLKIVEGCREKLFSFQEIENLDLLGWPDFEDYNLSYYKPILPLLSSRGCIRKCKFCSECFLYKKFRQHSPAYMSEYLTFLTRKHRIYHFTFQDSLINASLKWLESFCKNLIEKKLKIKWEAQIIIREDMDEDLFRLMKKCGCINLFIGLESASDRILSLMEKGFTQSQARNFFLKLKKADLHFEISLIVGYPQETEEDFTETLLFLKKNSRLIPKIAQISSFTLYKRSRLNKERPQLLKEEVIRKRLKKIMKLIEGEKIRYKKAFIDNLRYPDS